MVPTEPSAAGDAEGYGWQMVRFDTGRAGAGRGGLPGLVEQVLVGSADGLAGSATEAASFQMKIIFAGQ